LLENVILQRIQSSRDDVSCYQFGFKKGHSTGLCTYMVKQTVEYYTLGGSHVFLCFVDFTKAFDKVNYWKLFRMLLNDSLDLYCIKLLVFWYSNQMACVRWRNSISSAFHIGNGTKQGGILSPYLFTYYVRDIISSMVNCGVGCYVGEYCMNLFAYADDMVLLAPAWSAMQKMLNILKTVCNKYDIAINTQKTVCMVVNPKCSSKSLCESFPQFVLDQKLEFVTSFKYLGHVLMNNMSDNADIEREMRNMFARCHMLISRYKYCSLSVKCVLFRTYCLCMYNVSLWKNFTTTGLSKMKSCYHKCIKKFFGFARMDSMSQILIMLRLPSFDTVLHNARISFHKQCHVTSNCLIHYLLLLSDVSM